MKKVYIEEILNCSANMIKKIHDLNIYTVDDFEKNIYKIYSLYKSKIILDQYNDYIRQNKTFKYKELPITLKNVYIHQLPIEKKVKAYIIGIGIETFEELHILIQKNILKYKVSKIRYNNIMQAYNDIIKNCYNINKIFSSKEYNELDNHIFDSISNLSLSTKTLKKIKLYHIKTIRDLAIFIEKYDNIPYFDNETRIEIIENIKKYLQNKNKILTK